MKKVMGKDFVMQLLLGNPMSSRDLDIVGDVVIEGVTETEKLVLEGLDLENVDISGSVRIRNVVFNGDLNLYHARVAGATLIVENVVVNGNFAPPENFYEMAESNGMSVVVRNLSFTGLFQISV